jgi:hypothetical protein
VESGVTLTVATDEKEMVPRPGQKLIALVDAERGDLYGY